MTDLPTIPYRETRLLHVTIEKPKKTESFAQIFNRYYVPCFHALLNEYEIKKKENEKWRIANIRMNDQHGALIIIMEIGLIDEKKLAIRAKEFSDIITNKIT